MTSSGSNVNDPSAESLPCEIPKPVIEPSSVELEIPMPSISHKSIADNSSTKSNQ